MKKKKLDDGYNATIRSWQIGKEGHGIPTVWIELEHDKGSHQGFGGLCLDGGKLTRDFLKSVCAIFSTTDIESLKDRRCRALYNFPGWNQPIAGLETDKGRFTLYAWRKKHFPDKTEHPLDARRSDIELSIASHERALRELRAKLKRVEGEYVELDE